MTIYNFPTLLYPTREFPSQVCSPFNLLSEIHASTYRAEEIPSFHESYVEENGGVKVRGVGQIWLWITKTRTGSITVAKVQSSKKL